jgi:hypothetical protein
MEKNCNSGCIQVRMKTRSVKSNINWSEEFGLLLKQALEIENRPRGNNAQQFMNKFEGTFELLSLICKNQIAIARFITHLLSK